MPSHQPMAPITYWLLLMAAGFTTVLVLVLGFLCIAPSSSSKSDTGSFAFLALELATVVANKDVGFRWTVDDRRSTKVCFGHALEQSIGNGHDFVVFIPNVGPDQSNLTVGGFSDFDPTQVSIGREKSYHGPSPSQFHISLDDTKTELWVQTLCFCMEQDPSIMVPLSDCTLNALLDSAKDQVSALVATWQGPSSSDEAAAIESCLVHSYRTAFQKEAGVLPSRMAFTLKFTDDLASKLTATQQKTPDPTRKPMTTNQLRSNKGSIRSTRLNIFLSFLSVSKLPNMASESAVEELFCDCFRYSSEEAANAETCEVKTTSLLL